MKDIAISVLFVFMSISLMAQHSLSGKLMDESGMELVGATTVLLNATDSSMIAFNISNQNGEFLFEKIEEAELILQISYVSYDNISRKLDLEWSKSEINLGLFQMKPSTELLQEVTISAKHIPMGIRGDTITYNTAAFKTKPGATVEDLLKKLPGIEIDRNGTIKAQGEEVEKLLVDGKSFFGDDPKIATQNLEAIALDKVEVFDKASDIAEFTGVDDGLNKKAINLKLKEDYNKGGFGKVEIAGGTEARYDSKLNYNRFTPATQTAIIGASNNVNKQAFSMNDYISFLGGLSNVMSSANGIDALAESFSQNNIAREGLQGNTSIGLNFNSDFTDKLSMTSNYFFSRTDVNINRTSNGNQFLGKEEYMAIDTSFEDELNKAHRLNTKLEFKLNPFTQFILKNNISFSRDKNEDISRSIFQNSLFESSSRQSYRLDRDQWAYLGVLQLRRKFITKGRSVIGNLSIIKGQRNDENSILNNYFFGQSNTTFNQFQDYAKSEKGIEATVNFTEPISNKNYISAHFDYLYNREQPRKDFYDIMGQDDVFNNDLSTSFEKQFAYYRTGLSMRNNGRKLKLNYGIDVQLTSLRGITLAENNEVESRYFHILPIGKLTYKINSSKRLELSYNTSVTAPGLRQLNPVLDNTDPNLFVIGNMDLNPEYNHQLAIDFNQFDQFNFTNFFGNIGFNFIKNKIINEVNVKPDFTRVIRPINSDNYFNAYSYLSYGRPLSKLKLKFRLSSQAQLSNYETYLNGELNPVKESTLIGRMSFDNRKKKYFDLEAGIRVSYTKRQYDLNPDFNQSFFNYDLYIENDLFLPSNFTLSMSYDFKKFSNEFFSSSNTYSLLNLSIRKEFNNGKWSLEIKAFDLLDQNIGLRRTGGINSLSEIKYNTLRRHFMIGVNYSIGKIRKDSLNVR